MLNLIQYTIRRHRYPDNTQFKQLTKTIGIKEKSQADKEKSSSIISDPDGKENSRANYIGEYIVTLKGQIEYLRNEVFFFEKKITGKK